MSGIIEAPFEATEFAYLCLTAFATKDKTIKRLMKGTAMPPTSLVPAYSAATAT